MQPNQELKCLESIKRGNHHVYRRIVDSYKNKVFGLCIGLMKDEEEAKDAAQETFIKAYEKIGQFKGHSMFSTWLYKIAYRICLNKLRKAQNRPIKIDLNREAYEIQDTEKLYDQLESADRKHYLILAMEGLDIEEKNMLVLYYFRAHDIAELCKISGLSKSNVKIKLFRARKKLLKLLNKALRGELDTFGN